MNQVAVRCWAYTMIEQRAVVLDTETTGLTPGKIVDIALVDLATKTVLYQSLVNPETPIPPEATRIHGITDTMVAQAPVFAEIIPTLDALLRDRICIIFNVKFDCAFLRAEGLVTAPYRFLCAMTQARQYYGSARFSLQYACQQEGIDPGRAHRAVDDALATCALLHIWADHAPRELLPF